MYLFNFTWSDTDNTGEPDVASQPLWIASLCLSVFTIVVQTWLAILFLLQMRLWVQAKGKTGLASIGKSINRCALIVVVSPFGRYACTQSLIWFGVSDSATSMNCKVAEILAVIAATPPMSAMYMLLWLRVRAFCNNQALRHVYGTLTSFLTWVALFWGAGAILVIFVLATIQTEAKMSPYHGCLTVFRNNTKVYYRYIYAALSVPEQLLLLFLFIYPLHAFYKHRVLSRRVGETARFVKANIPNKKVYTAVRRNAVCAVVFIATDVLGKAVIGYVLPKLKWKGSIYYSVDDVCLLINVITTLGTFENWKSILFPFV